MTDAPTTKRQVIDRCHEAASRFDQALAGVSAARMLAPVATAEWSPRDILAHLYSDCRWFWGQMIAVVEGREPSPDECYGPYTPPGPEIDMSTFDGRNAFGQDRTRDLSLDDIMALHRDYRGALFQLLEQLPDEEFGRQYTIGDLGDIGHVRPAVPGEQGFPPSPLWQWVAGSVWHHYEEHAGDIEVLPGSPA
ncbi:MAG: DinB family protein [Dehalococcoidia bacterium]